MHVLTATCNLLMITGNNFLSSLCTFSAFHALYILYKSKKSNQIKKPKQCMKICSDLRIANDNDKPSKDK